jgi:hypothetical protein
MVEGAWAATNFLRRKRSLWSDAPSTTFRSLRELQAVPLPAIAGEEKIDSRSRAALFVRAPSFAASHCKKGSTKSMIPKSVHGFRIRSCPKRGRSAERRGVDSAGPPTSVAARLAFVAARAPFRDALASRRSTAVLAKGFHPWLSPVPRFMGADKRSAPRAASSWQTGVWPAGRVSEPPARSLRNRARAPLSLHLQDRIQNVPLRERDALF